MGIVTNTGQEWLDQQIRDRQTALRKAVYQGLMYSTPSAKSLVGVDERVILEALTQQGYMLTPVKHE